MLTENLFGMLHGFHADKNSITSLDLMQFLSARHETEQRLETTLESTRRFDMPHWEGMCLKVRGLLHKARGDEEAARNDLSTAIEVFERLESRLELARALVLRGEEDDLSRARDLFQSCGAQGDLENL